MSPPGPPPHRSLTPFPFGRLQKDGVSRDFSPTERRRTLQDGGPLGRELRPGGCEARCRCASPSPADTGRRGGGIRVADPEDAGDAAPGTPGRRGTAGPRHVRGGCRRPARRPSTGCRSAMPCTATARSPMRSTCAAIRGRLIGRALGAPSGLLAVAPPGIPGHGPGPPRGGGTRRARAARGSCDLPGRGPDRAPGVSGAMR